MFNNFVTVYVTQEDITKGQDWLRGNKETGDVFLECAIARAATRALSAEGGGIVEWGYETGKVFPTVEDVGRYKKRTADLVIPNYHQRDHVHQFVRDHDNRRVVEPFSFEMVVEPANQKSGEEANG